MSEIITCSCTESSITSTIIGEDLWLITPTNCRMEESDGKYSFYCKECNNLVDWVDKYMCKLDSNYKE